MRYLTFKLERKVIDELAKIPAQTIIRSTQAKTHVVEIDCSIITFKVVGDTLRAIFYIGTTKYQVDLLHCYQDSCIFNRKDFLNGVIDLLSDIVISGTDSET